MRLLLCNASHLRRSGFKFAEPGAGCIQWRALPTKFVVSPRPIQKYIRHKDSTNRTGLRPKKSSNNHGHRPEHLHSCNVQKKCDQMPAASPYRASNFNTVAALARARSCGFRFSMRPVAPRVKYHGPQVVTIQKSAFDCCRSWYTASCLFQFKS